MKTTEFRYTAEMFLPSLFHSDLCKPHGGTTVMRQLPPVTLATARVELDDVCPVPPESEMTMLNAAARELYRVRRHRDPAPHCRTHWDASGWHLVRWLTRQVSSGGQRVSPYAAWELLRRLDADDRYGVRVTVQHPDAPTTTSTTSAERRMRLRDLLAEPEPCW